MTIQHNAIPDAGLHEPKGVDVATSGQVYIANGSGGGVWTDLPNAGTLIGFLDYNDLATTTTPISVPGTSTYVYLTNDEAGPVTNKTYKPAGVTDVWDAAANKFDWSDLALGDMVDIRLDIQVTTTAANQDVTVVLEMATDGTPYDIPFASLGVKTAGTLNINRYNGVYMGDASTLTDRARFKIKSDASATVLVRGWYCKVLINR